MFGGLGDVELVGSVGYFERWAMGRFGRYGLRIGLSGVDSAKDVGIRPTICFRK